MPRVSQLNKLDEDQKLSIYSSLIPPTVCERFNIDPNNLKNCFNRSPICVEILCPPESMEASIEVKQDENPDSIFYIEISDSKDFVQLQWDFIKINDPDAPRYATNIDEQGRNRWLNWGGRNRPEELRAMEAGLAPGQTRCGMRIIREVNQCLDNLCREASLKSIQLEALFYHTAIQFERQGYRYFRGWKLMNRINELFQPGGKLREKLNSSTPFRRPEFVHSVRGRSWAIHDGILEEIDDPIVEIWEPPIMYRMAGERHAQETFSDGNY